MPVPAGHSRLKSRALSVSSLPADATRAALISIVGTFPVGTTPSGIAIDRANPLIYVTGFTSNIVTVVSTGGPLGVL